MVYQFYLSNIQALLKIKIYRFAHSSFICKEDLIILKYLKKHVNDSTISELSAATFHRPNHLYKER